MSHLIKMLILFIACAHVSNAQEVIVFDNGERLGNEITSDSKRGREIYFALYITCADSNKKLVTTTNSFYGFINRRKKMSWDAYLEYLRTLLKDNDTFAVSQGEYATLISGIVDEATYKELRKRTPRQVIERYFHGTELKPGLNKKTMNAVLFYVIERNIEIEFNRVTGRPKLMNFKTF